MVYVLLANASCFFFLDFGKNPFTSKSGPNKAKGFAGKKFNKTGGSNAKFDKTSNPKNSSEKDGTPQQTNEKPNWNEFKKNKKDLKLKRKGTNDLFELIVQAKKIYEQLKW